MNRLLQLTVPLTLVCLFALSCQTYVNIPPQTADTANHNPNGKTVREVLIYAIQAALRDGGINGPVQIMLPAGTDKLTYTYIANALGDQVYLPDEEQAETAEAVVFAKTIRIRGNKGEVDVARPAGEGLDQLVTVYLVWKPMGGWQATDVRIWRGVPIDE